MTHGFSVEHHAVIGSTNDRAKELAMQGQAHVCVTADGQTGGRGRRGRSFRSETGCGLYLSVVLPAEEAQMLTVRAAVAVAEAIGELTGVFPGIKWVNDLFLNGKKVCGILAEGVAGKPFAVLGIGINLKKQTFPEELRAIASDLESETGVLVEQTAMRDAILRRLSEPVPADLLARYEKRCFVLGKRVTVFRGSETFEALAVGLDAAGGLVVEHDGQRETLFSGEVSIKG